MPHWRAVSIRFITLRREHVKLLSPAIGRELDLIAYGHAGMAVLAFPSSEGNATDYEGFGMIETLAHLLNAGKLRLYCVSSYDSESWYGRHRPAHERAWRHSLYEDWIMKQVVPAIGRDVADANVRLTCTGCSFGAFHSALFALKHPKRFKMAIAMSGVYDIRFRLESHHDDWVYFNNPVEFVPNLQGAALNEIRVNTFIALVCGQGNYEERCLSSTKELWWLLGQKQIPNYMDLWGYDVAHDWPWWRVQIAHFMNHLVEGRSPWRST